MKAAVLHGIGERIQIEQLPELTAGPGEAVVRIQAASLNHRDVWIRKGLYAGLKFPITLGSDGAGTLVAGESDLIGKEVTIDPALAWGSRQEAQDASTFRILGLPDDGTFAEFVKVPLENVYPKPAHLTMEETAAIPLAGLTAFRAAISRGGLKPGETVLVTGAGGGVATFAVQIAAAAGATAYVTSGSEDKIATAVSLGATGGANYKAADWAKQLQSVAGGFDLIIDGAGGPDFGKLFDLAKPGGRIVIYGATVGNPSELPLPKIFWKQISFLGSTMGSPSDFQAMLAFFSDHQLKPKIDKTFSLEELDTALDHMDKGSQMGKIVIDVGK